MLCHAMNAAGSTGEMMREPRAENGATNQHNTLTHRDQVEPTGKLRIRRGRERKSSLFLFNNFAGF